MGREQAVASYACWADRQGQDRERVRQRRSPLILFLDTSALIKLVVAEEGTEQIRAAVGETSAIAAAALTHVEVYSALARMRAGGRLTAASHERARADFERFWGAVAAVEIGFDVIDQAARLAERHVLRAYDAMQLAAALAVHEAERTEFACFDGDLRKAADVERLTLVPA